MNAECRLGPRDGVHWGSTAGWRRRSRKVEECTRLTIDGVTMPIRAWAEKAGVNTGRVYGRLMLNWPPKAAVFAPVQDPRARRPRPSCMHDECWLVDGMAAACASASVRVGSKAGRR